ncbi:hypothetical protein HJ111_04675 [Vibrio parahaemolyticus]|nr:hypothetical protein [Vibrio parahaemolyticus]HDY7443088.1 hypothetical protein [Vibrio vulnificus]HDY7901505.1 hypothetical protein [Vibrio vulnificus]HDY7942492.1 hypothetical protein [Vibrio vulnificus]
MAEPYIVNSKADLKRALEIEASEIIITDKSLATQIKTVSYASKAALTAAIAGAAIASTNFWNPVGWGVAGFTAVSSGTLLTAIIALGVGTMVWVLWNDYDFSFEGGYKYTDPLGGKHEVYGKGTFKKHKK